MRGSPQHKLSPSNTRKTEGDSLDSSTSRFISTQRSYESITSAKVMGSLAPSDVGADPRLETVDSIHAQRERMSSIAWGESAAGRPCLEDVVKSSPYSGLFPTCKPMDATCLEPVIGQPDRSLGQNLQQNPLAHQGIHTNAECKCTPIETATLLFAVPQVSHTCQRTFRHVQYGPNPHGKSAGSVWTAAVTICVFLALFAYQVIDAGGAHVVIRHQDPLSKAALCARLAFNVGQAVGPIVSAAVHPLGPEGLVLNLGLGVICMLGAGLKINHYITQDVLRALTGLTSGNFLALTLNDMLAMLTFYGLGSLGILPILLFVILSQLAGSWISIAIGSSALWHLMYYAVAAILLCIGVLLFALVRRSKSDSRRLSSRSQIRETRTQWFGHWTRPMWLPFVHAHLGLAVLVTAIATGLLICIYACLNYLWQVAYHFTPAHSPLITTACLFASVLFGLLISVMLAQWHVPKLVQSNGDRNWQSGGHYYGHPERRLRQTICGLIVTTICLVSMAITTKTSISWMATALLLVVFTTAILLAISGGLDYVLEMYRPAYDEQGDWRHRYVLSGVTSCLITSIAVGAMVHIASPLAFIEFGFSTLCCILACCSLCGATIVSALHQFGPRLRKQQWDRFAASNASSNDAVASNGIPATVSMIISYPS